ncbi:MAG: hypothetical protein HDR71_01500 [Lachnospiraceae bacterium]|nr:hypothetical protein [Lachnospiraceae bacterium]
MNTSMKFSLFTASVVSGLQKKMGDDCRVFSNLVKKNNGIELTGIIVEEKNCNTSPTIYIDDFYDDYQKGASIDEIVEAVYGMINKNRFTQSVDLSDFTSYEKAAKQIAFKLINYEKNWELLKEIPHKAFLNLAIVFYYVVQEPPFYGKASILIRNSHLQAWGIRTEELYRNAMINTPVMLPAQIDNIEDAMIGMLTLEGVGDKWTDSILTKLQEDLKEDESRIPMYVLSNKQKIQGAACMLYPEILNDFAKEKNCDLYILPSSIHEVILLPDSKDISKENLLDMVSEINKTQVEEHEILADSIYYFSRFEKKIERIG